MRTMRTIGRLLGSILPKREHGQMLVLVGLLTTGLLGLVGLVVDAGSYYAERRQAQNGADEASEAAALELIYGGTTGDALATALENAGANGFDDSDPSDSVTVNIPPSSGPYAGDPNFVEVILSETPPTFFIHVLLPDGGQVSARGVAGLIPWDTGGSSVVGGAPDGCRRRDDEEEESGGVSTTGSGTTASAWTGSGSIPTASDSGDGVSNDGTTTSGASAEDESGTGATASAWTGTGTVPTASDSGDGVSNDGTTTSGASADDLSASGDAYDCVVLVQ